MKVSFEEFARKCRSFKGVSLLIMLIAGVLNLAVGLYPMGIAFLAITVVLAIRLARQNPDNRRW
jgi:uncharacterized membrane protein YiaA